MTHLGALLFNRWLPEAACGPRPQSRGFRFSRASGPLPGHLGRCPVLGCRGAVPSSGASAWGLVC